MADSDITLEAPGVGYVPGAEKMAPSLAEPKDKSAFDALAPGTKFLDPEGVTRVKPYTPKDEREFMQIPEGAQFVDPEGVTRQKPTYEGIDFTAQTLYDMALTPKEKRKALERSYPGKVKEGPEGLYIEDDSGVFRKPGRGINAYTGFAASAAAPVGLSVLGALGGGAAGTAVPVAGNVAGAAAGGAGGAVLGQSFNDMILQLAGVYDRTGGEETANLLKSGAMGMAGTGVGRGIAALVPSAKAGVSSVGQMLPGAVAHFLGATPETLGQAKQLAEKGVMVAPSAWAHESPHLQNLVEVFDPAFRTNKPLQQSAAAHYEKSAKEVLDSLGVQHEGSLLEPAAAVPTQAAGEKVLARTLAESQAADAKMQEALASRQAELAAGIPAKQAQREALERAAEESRDKAQALIDQGFKDIQKDADAAMKVAGAGGKSGDLWEHVGNKLSGIRQGISERARYWYGRYDQMTGGHSVSSQELADSARNMLEELPAEFKARNPSLVQKLSKIGAQVDEEGNLVKEAEQLTYGQLHDLRSLFRGSADWQTLSSDFKNGALKRFSNEIDRLIHDSEAPEAVRNGAKFLDMVDKWYGHNIRIFNANQIKAVMKGLEAGEPADPAMLYRVVVKEGHTDLTGRLKQMVGPNLWAGVKAADTQAMLDASKSLTPGVIDAKKFAREVLARHQSNMLETVHGAGADRLLAQARAIEQLDGKLPIPVQPGDTMTQVIQRARLAAEEAKAVGAKDPIGTLQRDMKRVENELKREASAARRKDPLAFLYNKSTGASDAVDKILGNEDLVLAAATRLGENSAEFNALRQVYLQRILQGAMRPGDKLQKVSPEVQRLMFPGVTGEQLKLLAKEMDFLTSTRAFRSNTAGGMAAMAKVEHPPLASVRGIVKRVPGIGQASEAGARAVLGKFYALVTRLATSPATLRFVEKGLLSKSPEEQEAVRQILRAHLQKGAAMGAGAGEAIYQGGVE